MSDKRLNFNRVLKMVMCDDEYIKDNLIDEMNYYMNDRKRTDFYEKNGDEYFMNVEGAVELLHNINIDTDNYLETLQFLNKSYKDRTLELNTDLNIKITNCDEINQNELKNYIEEICTNICTNGKRLADIDTTKLTNRDVKTINRAVGRYEDMARAGHKSNAKKLTSVYEYVERYDPDICSRMLYYYDYDDIDICDFIDRYTYMKYKELQKILNKGFKRKNKKRR